MHLTTFDAEFQEMASLTQEFWSHPQWEACLRRETNKSLSLLLNGSTRSIVSLFFCPLRKTGPILQGHH